jgi:preprotein translocase subunit SecD
MLIRSPGFNLYLICGLLLAATLGCKTNKQDKVLSTIRFHLETKPNTQDRMAKSETVEVYRQHPISFTVDRTAFLTEASVKGAKVIDVMGGFALQVQFDAQGTWLLEEYTSANRSRHIVIASQFVEPGEEQLNKGRYLGAPQIRTRIADGIFAFTPDATREEAEQIARGLNNVAERLSNGEPVKF